MKNVANKTRKGKMTKPPSAKPDGSVQGEIQYVILSVKRIRKLDSVWSLWIAEHSELLQKEDHRFVIERTVTENAKAVETKPVVNLSNPDYYASRTKTVPAANGKQTARKKKPSKKATLPKEMEAELASVDWSVRDVLVGSFGSVGQLQDNLRRNYYYVPARSAQDDYRSVRTVALYQSAKLFGEEAGIRYYGEVVRVESIRRGRIPFPTRRGNADELYYVFFVREWKTLPSVIAIKSEGVYAPKRTNSFLLMHAEHSYELFCVHSEAELRLLYGLKYALAQEESEEERLFDAGDDRTVRTKKDTFNLFNGRGERLLPNDLPISDFSRRPRDCFFQILRNVNSL